jgi:hypothetical protein
LFIYSSYFDKKIFNKKVYRDIYSFLALYLIVCILGICLYYFFSDFENAKNSTATRTDIIYIFTAIATLFAPLVVVYTFDSWKKQSFEKMRIQAVSQLKESLVQQHKAINLFLIRNSLDDLFISNKNFISRYFRANSKKLLLF